MSWKKRRKSRIPGFGNGFKQSSSDQLAGHFIDSLNFAALHESFIFVWACLAILAIVGLPIILAGILYYLMNPTVDYLERKGIKRIYSIFGLLFGGWSDCLGVVVIIPKIQEQSMSFADNLPGYLTIIENKVNEILSDQSSRKSKIRSKLPMRSWFLLWRISSKIFPAVRFKI